MNNFHLSVSQYQRLANYCNGFIFIETILLKHVIKSTVIIA
jgi:hypothetical protein